MTYFAAVSANTLLPMTSNVNARSNGQPTPTPGSNAPAVSAQAPSVPISLYREVSSELQTTRTTLSSLKTQNQELVQKNQQLRLEIERVVQSALHLRQLVDPSWGTGEPMTPFEADSEPTTPSMPLAVAAIAAPAGTLTPPSTPPEKLFTSQESQHRAIAKSESTSEIGTWWLVLVIFLIVVSAFGMGFLIVRPLLPSR